MSGETFEETFHHVKSSLIPHLSVLDSRRLDVKTRERDETPESQE